MIMMKHFIIFIGIGQLGNSSIMDARKKANKSNVQPTAAPVSGQLTGKRLCTFRSDDRWRVTADQQGIAIAA